MESTLAQILDLEGEEEIAKQNKVQSLFCIRAKRRAIRLADHLLDPGGKLQHIEETLALLETQGHILSLGGYNDSDITEHFIDVLHTLKTDKEVIRRLQGFGLPLCDPKLETILAIALSVEEVTDRHVVWAALSALLCPLRQSVGSCFASAPSILIHEQQRAQFLDDLQSLLSTGQIKRTFGGIEYSVPISPTPGLGDLKRNFEENTPGFTKALEAIGLFLKKTKKGSFRDILQELLLEHLGLRKKDLHIPRTKHTPKLEKIEKMEEMLQIAQWHFVAFADHLFLKMWEFTIASFADVKTEFSRWNLFSSLGLHPEEKGGIGEILYNHLEHKLEEANEKLEHFQREYEIAFDQVRATEHLLRGVSTEREARRLKAEHLTRLYHMNACEEMRDKYNFQAKHTSEFFAFLIESYVEKFQEYFQEIYDAQMHDVKGDQYDDSPAGFRLIFKHGRAHVRSWTFIHTKEEYIEALKEFFLSVEPYLIETCQWEEGKEEISHLTTTIIHYIRGEEFLTSAFYRMAKAHRVPLKKVSFEELDKMEKKPWAYPSGGTIPTLLKTYFRREGSLSEEARWVESPQDLLIFLLETLKMLPPRITDPFVQNPKKRMLMTSPTHAFSLYPGQELFRQGWEDPGFTYTWVRDQILLPRRNFYKKIRLQPHEQTLLLQDFAERLPLLLGHEIQKSFTPSDKPLSIPEFRRDLLKQLPSNVSGALDSFLFESLPLIQPEQMETILREFELKSLAPFKPMGRRQFHDFLTFQFLEKGKTYPEDIHKQIQEILEKKGLNPPKPLLFADTNWTKFYFSFLVNPATWEIELWRTDKIGLTGAPMREWEPYLNGTLRENWGVFLRPYEYSI